MKKRDFIALKDYSSEEILSLLKLAADIKKGKYTGKTPLKGKTIGLIFQKPSNRTRVSFEVGVYELGGNCLYLGPEEINLGKRETTGDVAQTLSRYLDGIVARTFFNKDVVELAKYSTVPVINGLCDLYHPCQALADLQSIQERFKKFKGLTLAFIGDGNNVCHSLMVGCAKVGVSINIAAPKGYQPLPEMVEIARSAGKKTGAEVTLTNSPQEAVQGAQIIYTDVWVSMGQEKEREQRLKLFQEYQINDNLTKLADKNFIFMHCLPAHRGEEVTADVIDGKHSIIFDQAENRLHAQKAVLMTLIK